MYDHLPESFRNPNSVLGIFDLGDIASVSAGVGCSEGGPVTSYEMGQHSLKMFSGGSTSLTKCEPGLCNISFALGAAKNPFSPPVGY